MSGRAKGLIMQLLERIVVGPTCPNCGHDVAIHWEEDDHCLGAVMDHGTQTGWCECTSTKRKPKTRK